MVSYCSSCGAEIKKGHKFCLNCGADLQSSSSSFEEQVAQTPTVSAPIPAQQPMPQQTYSQTQGYIPFEPRKSNKKLIAAILAIVIVVVVVLILVVFLFGKNAGTGDFVGTWTMDSMEVNGQSMPVPGGVTVRFNSDGTYEATSGGSAQTGTWEIKDGKFYTSSGSNSPFSSYSWSYQFSDGGNTLTMSCSVSSENESYNVNYVFKKSSSSSNSNGGTSHELDDDLVGSWTLTSMIYNGQSTPLSDITIDFNSDGTYESVRYTYTNETGTWYVSNGKLFFQVSSGYSMFYAPTGMDYQLSNGGNTLTFGYSTSYNGQTYSMSYVFERS